MLKNSIFTHHHWHKLISITLIIGMFCVLLINTEVEAADISVHNYVVQKGDTLTSISQKFNLNIGQLMLANSLDNSKIIAGQTLAIPMEQPVKQYRVQPGDNLSEISKAYASQVSSIKAMNNLQSNLIKPGEVLQVPVGPGDSTEQEEEIITSPVSTKVALSPTGQAVAISSTDLQWLAKLINAEARGESFEGKVAVGAVILNRMAHPEFPGSIQKIIFQKVKTTYQFTPVKDGRIYQDPDRDAYRAAEEALRGTDPTGGAIFFYNPKTASDRWIRTLPVSKTIGNHVFAK